jgi:predicted dithiol-disulfide oxidoreductase (DUF899 family)
VLFNFEERPMTAMDLGGTSVFYKDEEGEVYCTFQVRGRGGENLIGTYSHLDVTPLGRNENGPSHTLGDWVHLHDEYDNPKSASADGGKTMLNLRKGGRWQL